MSIFGDSVSKKHKIFMAYNQIYEHGSLKQYINNVKIAPPRKYSFIIQAAAGLNFYIPRI
eukprot:UN29086